MPGGTVSPWGRLSCAECHHVTLGRTGPCLVASRSFGGGRRHDTAMSPPGTIGPCLVGLCHPWEDQAMPGGTMSPWIRPYLVASCHPGSCHIWWHQVTLDQAMPWWHRVTLDQAVPGGTLSPSGGSGHALVAPCHPGSGHAWWHQVTPDQAMPWWHHVTLDQAMPGGTLSPSGGSGHGWWHQVTPDEAMPGGTVSPWIKPCPVALYHPNIEPFPWR